MGQPDPTFAGDPALPMTCSYRETSDDFFCLRYRVWYSSMDCAYRTHYRTAPGCLSCQQGRFNLKRHDDRFPAQRRT